MTLYQWFDIESGFPIQPVSLRYYVIICLKEEQVDGLIENSGQSSQQLASLHDEIKEKDQ